ncbi:MAG: tetratricopeptide repeat protein, partial [Cyanobacteria bacterium]|nr:tetratricopeptide repeat protein [Cyanobacteriota bacterium]
MTPENLSLEPNRSQTAFQNVRAGGNISATVNQTITIHDGQRAVLSYSDLLPDLRHFQGRTSELQDLLAWLEGGAITLVGVRGEGGIGKSTLIAKAFGDCRGFQRKFWVDVRTNTPITTLAGRALLELAVPLAEVEAIDEKDLPQRLLRHLQTGRYLLVIDNLESLLSPTGQWQSGYGAFLEAFRELGTQSVLLIASREYPERYYSWLHAQWLRLDQGLQPLEGAVLLRELGVAGSDDDLANASLEVQGHPLALALMAGWIREAAGPSGQRDIRRLEQFDHYFQIAGRHRGESGLSINRVLDWSWARLTADQQQLLGQVSVLRGWFAAATAQALAPEQSEVAAHLQDLERRYLVEEAVIAEQVQYRLQPRIQDYLYHRAGDLILAHERAIQYFWGRRLKTFPVDAPKAAASDYFETFYHQLQLGRFADAAQTTVACDAFLRRRGAYLELVELYGELHQQWHPAHGQRHAYAAICNNLGNAYKSLGQYQQAIDLHQQSLEIKREIGDQKGIANSLGNLGNAYYSLGQYQQAIDLHQQSLAIKREIGDQQGIAASLGNL